MFDYQLIDYVEPTELRPFIKPFVKYGLRNKMDYLIKASGRIWAIFTKGEYIDRGMKYKVCRRRLDEKTPI